jgi:hypothetical protein
VSAQAGIAVATTDPRFTPLVTEGLDMIAGQTEGTVIELAIDSDVAWPRAPICLGRPEER